MMKDKNVAALLAFFLGTFGIHRFYLGQIGLGIAYALFFWTGIPAILGFIDAIVLFAMDQDRFDMKYNWEYYRSDVRQRRERDFERRERDMRRRQNRDTDFDRRRRQRERNIEQWYSRQDRKNGTGKTQVQHQQRANEQKRWQEQQRQRALTQKKTSYKQIGIRKFKDYDYDAAIEQFLKVLDIDEKDVPTHFNLACAYSLNENAKESFHHLSKAVEHGFSDFKKIKEHDALAFLRIQPQFDEFEENGFRLPGSKEEEEEEQEAQQLDSPQEDLLQSSPDLLDQLQKLGELRDKGLLTEEEFDMQKKKLLN